MATYLDEMLKINRMFIRLFPKRLIYQQIDDGTVDYKQPFNTYLLDFLHSKGFEPSYESLMDYARNSGTWDEEGYSHSEYVSNSSSIYVEIESWKFDTKQKYALKCRTHPGYLKCRYRVHRLVNSRSSKTKMVFETHYEHKLLRYLLDTSLSQTCADIDGEDDYDAASEEEIAEEFVRHCTNFGMKIEADYIYGYIRSCVYVETYEDDMGCVQFMVYNESKDDWVTIYKTYSLDDMLKKLQFISEKDLWDTPYDYYEKKDMWWKRSQ